MRIRQAVTEGSAAGRGVAGSAEVLAAGRRARGGPLVVGSGAGLSSLRQPAAAADGMPPHLSSDAKTVACRACPEPDEAWFLWEMGPFFRSGGTQPDTYETDGGECKAKLAWASRCRSRATSGSPRARAWSRTAPAARSGRRSPCVSTRTRASTGRSMPRRREASRWGVPSASRRPPMRPRPARAAAGRRWRWSSASRRPTAIACGGRRPSCSRACARRPTTPSRSAGAGGSRTRTGATRSSTPGTRGGPARTPTSR